MIFVLEISEVFLITSWNLLPVIDLTCWQFFLYFSLFCLISWGTDSLYQFLVGLNLSLLKCALCWEMVTDGDKKNTCVQLHFILQKVSLDPGEQHKPLWCCGAVLIVSRGKFASLGWLPRGCDTEQQLAAPHSHRRKGWSRCLEKQ